MKSLFSAIAGGPLAIPALIALPALFIVFIGLGFTRNDIIEDDIYDLWASRGTDYYKDRQYAEEVGSVTMSSSLLAVATTRDGDNILTASKLEEIRTRMEKTESLTVDYNGNTFTWKDICASNNIGIGTVYNYPCVRLTAMDFFQESRWFFTDNDRNSWYNDGIKKNVVKPLIPRFGNMFNDCHNAYYNGVCSGLIITRVLANETLSLFGDINGMELNDPCRECIESNFEAGVSIVQGAIEGSFGVMSLELGRHYEFLAMQASPDLDKINKILGLLGMFSSILGKIDARDFLMYYTTRSLYASLGAESYIENYDTYNFFCGGCMSSLDERAAAFGLDIVQMAGFDLLQHADAAFSSINTAGLAYPETGFPRGGSGLSMAGTLLSTTAYLDLENYGTAAWSPLYGVDGYADPDDPLWLALVETDPMYIWYLAGEEPMTAKCGNDPLAAYFLFDQSWCTEYRPLEEVTETKQYFARMWYDLLIDSDGFLSLTQGVDDPYTWTNGEGCGYDLAGSRDIYTNKTEDEILLAASRELYYTDEGASIGALDKSLLIGGAVPSTVVSQDNPYESIKSFQMIYPAAVPENIVKRVKNCNRPGGALDITEDDATEILAQFKIDMVDTWSKGWDDESDGEVQFAGFFDSVGAAGTFTTVLTDISDDSGVLTLISVLLIAAMSCVFMFNSDLTKSRVGVTLVGVIIVLISFLGSLGFGVLVGIKLNVTMVWTLPFIIIGLGVDDMYIVLNAVKSQDGYSKDNFVEAMLEILAPVTMTSICNASMFAVMNISDTPAVYKTAQAALICVLFLYLSVILSFPAYCYYDMKRQEAKRCDIVGCKMSSSDATEDPDEPKDFFVYKGFKSLLLSGSPISMIAQLVVVLGAVALVVVGSIGFSQREIGVGLEEFFPVTNQANTWAAIRGEDLASWTLGINWGELDYSDPDVQLTMMKQYENVVDTTYVNQIHTDQLWIAAFNLWTTSHCGENFDRDEFGVRECGADQVFIGDADDNNTECSGTWVENTIGLREEVFTIIGSGECSSGAGGVCRPASQMFVDDLDDIGAVDTEGKSYCPVTEGWSAPKLKFCIEKWRDITGGGGSLLVEEGTATAYENELCPGEESGEFNSDDEIVFPIPISKSPTLYASGLSEHEDTVNLIEETRAVCDEDDTIHCFTSGIPYDYWEQYLTVDETLATLCSVATAVGFVVATVFLFFQLDPADESYGTGSKLIASITGGLLIAVSIILSLIPVIGISLLLSVNLTAFSMMSFVLSVAFTTEYSVHIIHRFLSAPTDIDLATERVQYTMQFLTQPLTLAFLSSTIGVLCLAFTDFAFNERFFFRPLMVVMLCTFYMGAIFLPVVLTKLNFGFLKVGHKGEEEVAAGKKEEKFSDDE